MTIEFSKVVIAKGVQAANEIVVVTPNLAGEITNNGSNIIALCLKFFEGQGIENIMSDLLRCRV